MVEWQVFRDGTQESDVFDVAPVVDTINPFGDYAVVKIDDSQGEKFEQYQRGTELELQVIPEPGDTAISRFTGYVVERRELDQDGADVLEVEAYTFDQFLRRNTVSNDQTGNTISEALADIIQTDTPITYNSANVEVGDPQELTRSYRGEPVESALRDLTFKSTNENFGVNDSREFFFRPRETVHIDRGIDNETWLNYDIPELGKEEINEVEVWYNDGNESVIVDNGQSKLDLEESLGLASPGTQRAEINRPRLTDISDAEDAGRQYLKFRNTTLSGEITTFGLFEATPGDTIDVTIPQRGINTEFQIVSIEYEWGRDETRVEVVEKRGFTDDILVRLGEAIQREEMQGADRDAPKNRITTTQAGAIIDVSVSADGNVPTDTRFVNPGRNKLRDGWKGDGNPDITTLVVGDDNSGLSRSNTTLVNQTNSASVTENLPSAKVVEYSASITQTGVQELGLETTDGTLMCRAVFDTAVDLSGTVTVTLTVLNDDSVDRGVLTNDGQTAVRDVLADNSPTLPTDYAYGSSGTTVAETDTALGNELISQSLESILLQSANSTQSWEQITDLSRDDGFVVDGGVAVAQSAYFSEGEDFLSLASPVASGDDYSSGEAAVFDSEGESSSFFFTPDYTISASDVEAQIRFELPTAPGPDIELRLNGNVIGSFFPTSSATFPLQWYNLGTYDGPDLEQGQAQEFEVVVVDDDGGTTTEDWRVDCAVVYDSRFEHQFTGNKNEFDETLDAVGGYLVDPLLYRRQALFSLSTATTRRNVTEANFTSVINDTTNVQYVELANDGTNFTQFNNTTSGSVTFASPESGVDTNISLSSFGADRDQTPTTGYQGQKISEWQLFANPDAVIEDGIGETLTRAVIPPDTSGIVGQTVRECGLKNGSTLLSRHQLADFVLASGQQLASSESTTFKGTE